MSAYLVPPQQIGIIVSAFGDRPKYANVESREYYGNKIKDLADTNIASIGVKYEGLVETENFVPTLEEKNMVCQAWLKMSYEEYLNIATKTYLNCVADPFGKLAKYTAPVQILSYCKCYEYQSCEFQGYYESEGHRVKEWAMGAAIRKLPGYDDAEWSYEESEVMDNYLENGFHNNTIMGMVKRINKEGV